MRRLCLLAALALGAGCSSKPAAKTPSEPGKVNEFADASVETLKTKASETKSVADRAKIASELESRGALTDDEIKQLVYDVAAPDLEAFAGGAAEGSKLRELASKRLEALRKHTSIKPSTASKIAVALPLTGKHRGLGGEFRVAIELAAKDTRVEILFVDTQGTEAGARDAIAKAAKDGAGVVLGPIGERESRAAAAEAARLGLAIGLLSPDESGAAPSVGVFRLWPSRESEAAEAAGIAIELGYDAPAVLAPRDELGRAAAEAFVAAAKKAGASSVRAGYYDPTATELEPDLKKFLGLNPATNERLRRHLRRKGRKKGWKSFSPDIDFDLLYIPDTYDRAALVASYLPFFNVELRAGELVDTMSLRRKHGGRIPSIVQLLGSREWHHPSLFARGGSAVEGALIAETCVGGPSEDYLDDDSALLARRLRRAIGRSPSRFASQAYDVAKMIFERHRGGHRGRNLFVGAKSKGGACGPSEVDGAGQLRRESVLLMVDSGELTLHEW